MAGLGAAEPSLSFVAAGTASANAKQVSVTTSGSPAGQFAAAAMSASGKCFYIRDIAIGSPGGTYYGNTTTAGNCTGTRALTTATTQNTPAKGGW